MVAPGGPGVTALAVYLVVHYRGPLWAWTISWYDWATDKQKLKAALDAAGPMAPVLFIAIQALQVFSRPSPGKPPVS